MNADSDELVISGKCGIINECASRLEEIDTLAASILTCATRLLQQNCAAEEALMVVSTVSQRCPAACAAVASSLCPLIHGYVTDVSRETIFITALGVFGDICRCVGEQGQHHVEQFMTSLLGYLRNPDLPSKLTISVIDAIADASLYLGSGFRTYAAASMQALVAKASEAATLPLEERSLCEAFTCVVQHIHHHGYAGDLSQFASAVIKFLLSCSENSRDNAELTDSMAGLIGDLAQVPNIKSILSGEPAVFSLLNALPGPTSQWAMQQLW